MIVGDIDCTGAVGDFACQANTAVIMGNVKSTESTGFVTFFRNIVLGDVTMLRNGPNPVRIGANNLMFGNLTCIDNDLVLPLGIYDESVSGDLPTFASQSPVFALDKGTNTFTGEITFSNIVSIGGDFDSFAFSVPNNSSLVRILIDIALLPLGAGIFNNTRFSLQNSSFLFIDSSGNIPIPSSNLSLFSSSLPLAPSVYGIQHASIGGPPEAWA